MGFNDFGATSPVNSTSILCDRIRSHFHPRRGMDRSFDGIGSSNHDPGRDRSTCPELAICLPMVLFGAIQSIGSSTGILAYIHMGISARHHLRVVPSDTRLGPSFTSFPGFRYHRLCPEYHYL